MKIYKDIIKNRKDAAKQLRELIPMQRLKDEDWMIVGVSKGGLDLAHSIRKKLPNKLDFLFSQSIKAPQNSECEIARVSESEEMVINEGLVKTFDICYDYIYGEARRKHEEKMLSNIYQHRKGLPFSSVKNKVVLLVDEGSETGLKFMTALKTILVGQPKAVYIAVTVLPTDTLELLEPYADDIFYLYSIDDFVETSLYYKELEEIDDDLIEKYLGEKNDI